MDFEFDFRKSVINKSKHGIDFNEAQVLWDDPDLIEVPLKTSDEPRFLVIGKISGKHWSGIKTFRNGKTRIISVRRSRKEEVEIYESYQG
ncbi:MAG: BrnT family toxin [Nitrospirae bacterium]|nr:BrnT family toxin [Nitrospirota bacterium]